MTDTIRSGAALIAASAIAFGNEDRHQELQMQGRRIVAALSAVIILSGAGELAFAQQPSKPAPGTSGAERSSMDHGMMGGRSMGGGMMLQLPPGNEKLQFQMHAEMAQKMGEIAAKYVERIK